MRGFGGVFKQAVVAGIDYQSQLIRMSVVADEVHVFRLDPDRSLTPIGAFEVVKIEYNPVRINQLKRFIIFDGSVSFERNRDQLFISCCRYFF